MSNDESEQTRRVQNVRSAHPLTHHLLRSLSATDRTILEIGAGSGRNLAALLRANLKVTSVDENPERVSRLRREYPKIGNRLLCASYTQLPNGGDGYDALLSTHALLHGDVSRIQAVLAEMHRVLRPEGRAYVTLGSSQDARFGQGGAIGEATFVAVSGDERGVAHSYFDRSGVQTLLRAFSIAELDLNAVDEIAGKWAHETAPLRGAVHWFAVVQKPR